MNFKPKDIQLVNFLIKTGVILTVLFFFFTFLLVLVCNLNKGIELETHNLKIISDGLLISQFNFLKLFLKIFSLVSFLPSFIIWLIILSFIDIGFSILFIFLKIIVYFFSFSNIIFACRVSFFNNLSTVTQKNFSFLYVIPLTGIFQKSLNFLK